MGCPVTVSGEQSEALDIESGSGQKRDAHGEHETGHGQKADKHREYPETGHSQNSDTCTETASSGEPHDSADKKYNDYVVLGDDQPRETSSVQSALSELLQPSVSGGRVEGTEEGSMEYEALSLLRLMNK